MDKRYFMMSTSIVDRQDLDIYEKMCAAVLSRYVGREEFDNLITLEVIALKMAASIDVAEYCIASLLKKGLISDKDIKIKDVKFQDFTKDVEPDFPATTQTREQTAKSDPKKVGQEELIKLVYGIINEKINSREARIILNFADNDIELIREKYKKVKGSQVGDKVELLMVELQKKSQTESVPRKEMRKTSANENLSGSGVEYDAGIFPGQINLNTLNKLKAYRETFNLAKTGDDDEES